MFNNSLLKRAKYCLLLTTSFIGELKTSFMRTGTQFCFHCESLTYFDENGNCTALDCGKHITDPIQDKNKDKDEDKYKDLNL